MVDDDNRQTVGTGTDVGTEGLSQAEIAYQLIKRDILNCTLDPGSRITESEFSERYAVGRAAVRTALNRLYQEALVEVLPRYGYLIAPQNVADARNLFQLQLILEPAAGRLAAGRVDGQHLLELDEACRRSASIATADEAATFLHANTNFHASVAAAAGNPLMARFVRILFERLERFLYASGCFEAAVRDVSHTHEEVIELLIAGKAEEVERQIYEQVKRNHEVILATLAEHGRL